MEILEEKIEKLSELVKANVKDPFIQTDAEILARDCLRLLEGFQHEDVLEAEIELIEEELFNFYDELQEWMYLHLDANPESKPSLASILENIKRFASSSGRSNGVW